MKNYLKEFVRFATKWAWAKEIDTANGLISLTEMHATPGKLELHLKQNPEVAWMVATSFASILADAPNYTEMQLNHVDTHERFTVTIRREKGKTPNELKVEAESRTHLLYKIIKEMLPPEILHTYTVMEGNPLVRLYRLDKFIKSAHPGINPTIIADINHKVSTVL